jgi:hypothetical protein
MKLSSIWTRRALIWSAAGVLAIASIVAASAADAAHTTAGSRPAARSGGVGYPTPKGIYAPFTDCPLTNPLMQEAIPGADGGVVGCVAGDVVSGTIKIGNVTTKIKPSATVKYPVTVQYGIWTPPAATGEFTGGILLPPVGGASAELDSSPQFVRGGLLKALGCSTTTNATVKALCTEAQKKRGKYLKVFAAAQTAGPITNFDLLSWTQAVMFHLINPLLGANCYIGSDDNPVMLNPMLTGSAIVDNDPHPRYHPDTEVIQVNDASATDKTFTAPGVTGCGPGGTANIAVDEAIDGAVGLPTASGSDSITLSGTFYVAASAAPQNEAKVLLSAFRASARSGGTAVVQRISRAELRQGLLAILQH